MQTQLRIASKFVVLKAPQFGIAERSERDTALLNSRAKSGGWLEIVSTSLRGFRRR